MNERTEATREPMTPRERASIEMHVEDAIDAHCQECGIRLDDKERIAGVYSAVLVHAIWALADIGIGKDDLVSICSAIANDAQIAVEVEETMTSAGGSA